MPYPDTPFEDNFNSSLIIGLNEEEYSTAILKDHFEKTSKWLCSSPKITSYRVNYLKSNSEEVLEMTRKYISKVLGTNSVIVEKHLLIPNVIVIQHDLEKKILEKYDKEVVVDVDCASAVLRGAHIYAPGVLAMMSGTQVGDKISIYADSKKKCKRGLQKLYEDNGKIFIGNGESKMVRHELFGENLALSGVAVQVIDTISGCPSLGDNFLPPGLALLQNLPSILCVYALEPQPSEKILDMCAAPGNKTTHIAELMRNKGDVVAIDKTLKKTNQLKNRCAEFGAKAHIFDADSTKIYSDDSVRKCVENGPPFSSETFDRILLDTPCSVLGKRPQLVNSTSEKVIRSYVPLQRKLFKTLYRVFNSTDTEQCRHV
ncbi:putative methyltransferase NSUN6 isoform X2 [Anoplophora glabripennis]|uniref:putative methyltransferase NSUN6 isoform X2 n=1 Tax=Anoplophora glabripennis TaxID=217634 RepID=UPI000C775A3E|nr:putative methyltransferase NSUN6 isoform X2 [Anoplophora glabripennis]